MAAVEKTGLRQKSASALFSALSVIALILASAVPAGKAAIFSAAVFISALIIFEFGTHLWLYHYLSVSILSLMLAPSKLPVLVYVFYFGYYPLIFDRKGHSLPRKTLFLILRAILFRTALLPFLKGAALLSGIRMPKTAAIPFSVFTILLFALTEFVFYMGKAAYLSKIRPALLKSFPDIFKNAASF